MLCAGTHPMTDWATQEFSPGERYQALLDKTQWLARQLQIFGVHVHVGVRSPEKSIPIVNALTTYIPHFLALSASSPYWIGHDTGLASSRSKVFEGLPTAGLPFQLADWAEFEQYMETLIKTGTIRLHQGGAGGTSGRIRPTAPWSCASATGSRPSARSAWWRR